MPFFSRFVRLFPAVIIIPIFLSACTTTAASISTPTPDSVATKIFEDALLTATYAVPSITPTLTPSPTPTLTPTPLRTPPVLQPAFHTDLLNPRDVPVSYIQDTCKILKMRWDPNNASPGTVVMPIMFHSITDGEINKEYQITAEALTQLLRDLKSQGFEAISMEQVAGFLQRNAKIPPRSVLLIVDDLHTEEYYRKHFVPILEEYGWTMTNAWISEPEASKRVAAGNILLQQEGWVDHQAHGVVHNVNITEFKPFTFIKTDLYGEISSDQFIHNELGGSMEAIAETFGKAPIAYIWPGGNFGARGIEVAQQVGFQLGFTVNPRGPLMFNWIPQGTQADPNRPSYIAEGPYNSPMMLLPRFWDSDARYHLDTVRRIGKDAAAYAEQNRAIELEYYDIVCSPKLGPLPTLTP